MIQRRAIDSSGSLGSHYDRCRDCVLERPTVTSRVQELPLDGSIRCELIEGKTDKSRNLLETIGIDADLRLKILLDPESQTGVAAFVDHPQPMDQYTRFLYFFYADREQRFLDEEADTRKCVKSLLRSADATHIITAVSFGIEILVVLHLPCEDNTVLKIDIALKKIQTRLEESNDVSNLTNDDRDFLGKISDTKAYSNVPEVTEMTSLLQICQYIIGLKRNSDTYRSLVYTLQPIKWLYPDAQEPYALYNPLEESESDNLEQHLIKSSNTIRRLKYWFNYNVIPLHFQYLQGQLDEVRSQWQSLKEAYKDEIKRLRNLMFDICSGQKNTSKIDEALKHENQTTLRENIRKLMQEVNDLDAKGQLICSLEQQHFKYCNVAEHHVDQNDTEQTFEHKLITDNQHDRILCSNDELNESNRSKLNKLRDQLAKEQKTNPDLHLIYADFSYCSFQLQDMIILPSNKQKSDTNEIKQSSLSPSRETQTFVTPSSPENEVINILLLGESGVGKSTFINAFVNYLKFKTFKQAQSGTPVVLIPVSFLITTGNNFEEHIVKFGDSDNLNNEDFDHPGQSVTQQCKSYVFNLNRIYGKKLCIIDTPGFGDTRGLDQDVVNMEHILEYINNLTHLNAICFLLKPNASQINNFFRTCLTQLLDLLGPNARQNIIFCFTNARSTFYTPGDTAPLLKDILKSLSMGDIPFNKENTFCFDNESFRYLIALQNLIKFDEHDKEEYEISWSKSVNESQHLCDYICKNLTACYIRDEHQSIKHAQLKIIPMIRPMLEAMRNILRNITLWNMDAPKSIELIPESLHHPAAACFRCKRNPTQIGKFWIVRNVPHKIQKKCSTCLCDLSQHVAMNYKLDYEYSDTSSTYNRDEMKKNLNILHHASVEFAHFLMYVARSSKDDPFWIGITQMISEENDICKSQKPNEMNLQLVKDLRELMRKYEQRIDNIESNQEHSKLSVIYELIQTIRKYPMVQEQVDAIKQTQTEIMKLYEYKVPEDRS